MTFIWARMLWFLALVPALVAAYILAQRRRQRYALRYASLSLVKDALGKGPGVPQAHPRGSFHCRSCRDRSSRLPGPRQP